jgi:hypothetical protein
MRCGGADGVRVCVGVGVTVGIGVEALPRACAVPDLSRRPTVGDAVAVATGGSVLGAGEATAISVGEGTAVGIGVGGMGVAEGVTVITPSPFMLNLVGGGEERGSA